MRPTCANETCPSPCWIPARWSTSTPRGGWQTSLPWSAGRCLSRDTVAREAQYVLRGGSGDDAREREPIDLQPLIDTGLLQVIATGVEEELLTYMDLTLEIGRGEAMTGALAIHRGCIVVIDDRKGSRVLGARGVALRTSLDLIRVCGAGSGISPRIVRDALVGVRQRGNYEPRRRQISQEAKELPLVPIRPSGDNE